MAGQSTPCVHVGRPGRKPPAGRTLFVGIDIAKDTLVVAAPGLHFTVANLRAGWSELLAKVRALKRRVHFACENDQSYGRGFIAFLFTRDCRFSLLAAFKIRQFAKATSRMAKTDYLDAEMIAEYAATFRLPPAVRPSRPQLKLRDLSRRRGQLVRLVADQKRQVLQLWNRNLRRDGPGIGAQRARGH